LQVRISNEFLSGSSVSPAFKRGGQPTESSQLACGFNRAHRQAVVSCIPPQQLFEILDGLHQTIPQLHLGSPWEQFLRHADVGATLSWIILGQRPVSNL